MGSRIGRRSVAAIIGVIGLASLASVPAGAASAGNATPFAAGSYRVLPAAQLVSPRKLPASVPGAQPSSVRPKLVKNHNAPARSTAPAVARAPKPASIFSGPVQGNVLEQLAAFPAMDVTTGVGMFGQSQNMEPPDTQLAVGPDLVVEMVNANMSVWSKTGTRMAAFNLNAFYSVPAGYLITDPRIIFDRNSGRFLASAVAIASNWSSNLYLAVSQSSDPLGAWTKQTLKATNGVLIDQPKVGTSDDKITLDWSEWLKPGCDPQYPNRACFVGEAFSVIDKADMLWGGVAYQYMSGQDPYHFAVVPAQALSSTTTQYMVYNNADPYYLVENQCSQPTPPPQYGTCPTIGILTITGSARGQTISILETDQPIGASTLPPNAVQQGNAALIDTGDDRYLTAVWQNNHLWTTGGEGNFCPATNPIGPPARACARVVKVLTDTIPMTVIRDNMLDSGDYSYHPSLSLDSVGDLFVVFSRSSSTLYPSVWMTGLPISNTWSSYVPLAAGTGPYDSKTACGGGNRWGDYSGASIDGGDPTDIWVAGEYAISDPTHNCTWGTAIGQFTYSAPTITSITPDTGPGGTSVTITGTNFVTGGTTPYFGATPSPSNTTTVLSANKLTTTAPPGSGWVSLSASTADGHGPPGAFFKYPRLEAAPGSFASHAGTSARGAPPPVPTKSAGPRPLSPQPAMPERETEVGTIQPVRLFRLLLL